MGKYFMTWKIDPKMIPVSPDERAAAWQPMIEMVKKGMSDGLIKEWGAFVGENSGYSIAEGSEVEIGTLNQQWVPFVKFEGHAVASIEDIEKVINNLSK